MGEEGISKNEIDVRAANIIDKASKSFVLEMVKNINPIFGEVLSVIAGKTTFPGVVEWSTYLDTLVKDKYIDQPTADYMKNLKDETPVLKWVVMLLMKAMLWFKEFTTNMDVYQVDRSYKAFHETQPHPAPPESLIQAMILDPGRTTANREQMKRLGYNDEQIDNMILSHYSRVPLDVIRTLYLRGHYDSTKLYERMRELGFTDTRTAEIIKTWQVYPGPQDLFTMVAHEAFEPDQYVTMGLDQEFPSEQLKWLEAQGISQELATKFWISHWEQPSISQGFEMLHRGIISEAELDMLFKVVEIPVYWRDKLKKINYIPYTRVDVRRMHDLGVLDNKELVLAYQDLGYDATKAVKMAEFTIRYNDQAKNDLTREAILKSYHDDLISKTDAKELLTSIKISDESADYYITMEDFKINQETVKIYLDTFKERFLLGVDKETTTRSNLNKLGLRGTKIDALVENWKTDAYKYEALPTKAELADMLAAKIIPEGIWRDLMTRQGYSYEVQSWYLALLKRQVNVSQTMPSRTDLQNWLKAELITQQVFKDNMKLLGYSDYFIDLYIKNL